MVRRVCIYVMGTLILALGLVLNSKTGLGVSAILSLPFSLSTFTSLSFGTWTSILYVCFVVTELVILRKADWMVMLQFPFSIVFGRIIDFYNTFLKIEGPSLVLSLVLLALAVFLTALGVVIMVSMKLIVNPADGCVSTIAAVVKKPMGTVKMMMDISMLCITLIICLLFVHRIVGIGIGTLVSAALIGPLINLLTSKLKQPLSRAAGIE